MTPTKTIEAQPLDQVQLIDAGLIVNMPERDELRYTDDELDQLEASMRDHHAATGHYLESPITLRPDGDRFKIVFGRHRAYTLAHRIKTPLESLVRDYKTDADAAVAAISENLNRKDMAPLEEARMIKDALDAGLTQVQLAKRLKISQPRISKRIKLLQVPAEIAELAGVVIGVDDAGAFAGLGHYPVLTRHICNGLAQLHEKQERQVQQGQFARVIRAAAMHADSELCDPFDNDFVAKIAKKPSWQMWSLTQSQAYKARFKDLETVSFAANTVTLYKDPVETREIMKLAVAEYKQQEQKAKPAAKPAKKSETVASVDWEARFAGELRKEREHRRLECFEKQVQSLAKPTDLAEALAVAVVGEWYEYCDVPEAETLQRLRGLLGDAANTWTDEEWEAGEIAFGLDAYQQLLEKSKPAATVLLAYHTLELVEGFSRGQMPDVVAKAILGETTAQMEAVAERRAKATVDAMKKEHEAAQGAAEAKKAARGKGAKPPAARDASPAVAKKTKKTPTKKPAAAKKAPAKAKTEAPKNGAKNAAKPPTNPDGPATTTKAPTKAQQRRADALQLAKDLPHGCIMGGCNERFKTKAQQQAHDKVCPVRLKHQNTKTPQAPTPKIKRHHKGKECPDCLTVLNVVDGAERCLFCNPLPEQTGPVGA